MATITFDTREAVRNLTTAGFPEEQADAVVDTLAGALSDTVATKADIAALEATTKADIAEVRGEIAEVKAEIANLRAEMFRALWIQGGGIVALIVGLLKFT